MKKILLTLTLVVTSMAAFGQGQILFQNANPTAITNSLTSAKAIVSTRVGLYVNLNTAALESDPGWTLQGTTNLAAAGLYFGGTRTLTGIGGGTPVAVQVRAWLSATPFISYEEALGGAANDLLIGVSGIMRTLVTGTSPSPAPTLVANGLTSITLVPNVPEPSSIALGLLGLGAVALFRRRK